MTGRVISRWEGYTMYTVTDEIIGGIVQADVNDGSDVAYIYNLNIAKNFRGAGFGKKMLDAIEALIPHCKTYELSVNCTSYGLLQWYEKIGYHNTGVKVWHENTHQHRWVLRKTV